ncbi:hypothetical protein [Alcanivorax sp. 1008]|uniref:hypothetical protein n=1 Tax=Alcanivorax sp. 1008 TaxID=2816853 RepID=UPI001D29B177|nr:hypothetical protein [Alcanivorax sp. 1008]MCC1497998.1 hypothetical protein [Alcanivorax sp. 1008]
MIKEYAIDPEIIFETAKDEKASRQLKKAFGVGRPRIASTFPKQKPQKWASFCRQFTPADILPMAQQRADALIDAFKDACVHRGGVISSGTEGWPDDVIAENQRLAFDVVLSNRELDLQNLLPLDQIDEEGSLWECEEQFQPQRTEEGLCSVVGNLLACSKKIVVVEPYARNNRAIVSICAFIQTAFRNRRPSEPLQFQVLYRNDDGGERVADFILDQVSRRLGRIEYEFELTVKGLIEYPRGEAIHNRYILTELGGVSFGYGTDVGEEFHTDDVILLHKEMRQRRWDQYVEEPLGFQVGVVRRRRMGRQAGAGR